MKWLLQKHAFPAGVHILTCILLCLYLTLLVFTVTSPSSSQEHAVYPLNRKLLETCLTLPKRSYLLVCSTLIHIKHSAQYSPTLPIQECPLIIFFLSLNAI